MYKWHAAVLEIMFASNFCMAVAGQLIFVRSYFDFVRLRNFLKEEAASFVGLCEYAKHSDVSRGRSNFFHGRRRIMLYTERAHFYHRYRLRGVKVGQPSPWQCHVISM